MELNKFSLFKGLNSVQIAKFQQVITFKKFKSADLIIKEGDKGDSIQGEQGFRGEQGPKGEKGERGDKGERGLTGPK